MRENDWQRNDEKRRTEMKREEKMKRRQSGQGEYKSGIICTFSVEARRVGDKGCRLLAVEWGCPAAREECPICGELLDTGHWTDSRLQWVKEKEI
jgi:hypothetical protein